MELSRFYIAILVLSLFLFLIWISNKSINKKRLPPEAGDSWPVIGHLLVLAGKKAPHLTMAEWADKHGPVFTIKMGLRRVLVACSWETAKECLTTKDRVFATRPNTIAMQVLGYNHANFGFAPYGPYWQRVRTIASLELHSPHRLQMLKQLRESEVKMSLRELYEIWEKNKNGSSKALVKISEWLTNVSRNAIMKFIAGKRISGLGNDAKTEKWRKAFKEFFWRGKFVIGDAFPFLRWLDIGGSERLMKELKDELNEITEEWLQEHKQKKALEEFKVDEDFMDVMLSAITDAEDFDADTINKATCLALILAGSDTTAVTLTWALALLLNNPDVLKKAKQELIIRVGTDNLVEENDLGNLVYLQAIVKETLRLYPAAPLSVPHESMEDCTVSGYHIPAGTILQINLHKIHRDPRVWSNPDKFEPERFLTAHKHFDVTGQNFELMPFGNGRRMCVGVSFALQVVQLALANLLQGFELARPSDEPVDMQVATGTSINFKATPLQICISPRFPASRYELL